MVASKESLDAWASAYIKAQSAGPVSREDANWWAIRKFDEAADLEPELCWTAILAVLRKSPNDNVVAAIGAGPLEDLIQLHGPDFVEVIAAEAEHNPSLGAALQKVWLESSEDETTRAYMALGCDVFLRQE